MLQRTDAEWSDPGWVEHAPGTTQAVLGFDDTTGEITQLYADERAVHRIYRGTLTDSVWQMGRAAPGFHQRFIGAMSDDGRTTEGRWESSPDGTQTRSTPMNQAQTQAAEPITRTLEVPGATLTYDVRTNEATTEPPLMLIGSPRERPDSGRSPASSPTGRS